MNVQQSLLVFGATGQTGQHFTRLALRDGHRVRAVARTPGKLAFAHDQLEIVQGSITDDLDLDALLDGVDAVVAMLGDAAAQRESQINTAFVRSLVPAMRRSHTRRFLYQAGGLSAAPGKRLSPALRVIRRTVARSFAGQHSDNEAVMRYLDHDARDVEWIVHRAGIGSDGPSKGELHRSSSAISIGTFSDCAAYNLRTLMDDSAVHSCDGSTYRRRRRSSPPASGPVLRQGSRPRTVPSMTSNPAQGWSAGGAAVRRDRSSVSRCPCRPSGAAASRPASGSGRTGDRRRGRAG